MLSISRQVSISAGAISRGPVNSTPPLLSYNLPLHPGDVVSCGGGVWDRAGTPAYQWYRNGVAISGEIASNYALNEYSDFGTIILCRVTFTNAQGANTSTSDVIAVDFPQTALTSSEIGYGLGTNYEMLVPPTWEQTPLSENYQWLLNGTAVSGQTSIEYTGPGMTGEEIQLEVTAENVWYSTTSYSNIITL
jgi:hypothetical protein